MHHQRRAQLNRLALCTFTWLKTHHQSEETLQFTGTRMTSTVKKTANKDALNITDIFTGWSQVSILQPSNGQTVSISSSSSSKPDSEDKTIAAIYLNESRTRPTAKSTSKSWYPKALANYCGENFTDSRTQRQQLTNFALSSTENNRTWWGNGSLRFYFLASESNFLIPTPTHY